MIIGEVHDFCGARVLVPLSAPRQFRILELSRLADDLYELTRWADVAVGPLEGSLREVGMGDYRITIEAVGGHGCGREAKDGDVVTRCGSPSCPDCNAIALVQELGRTGNTVSLAKLEHWPVPGAAGCTRTEKPGPVDDLIAGTRAGSFSS